MEISTFFGENFAFSRVKCVAIFAYKKVHFVVAGGRFVKRIYLPIAILIFVFLLSSCSTQPASQKEILSEIAEYENFNDIGMSITDFSETKRQTDKKNKTDVVWVSIVAENDYCEYQADYVLHYSEYNSGWLLENIVCEYASPYKAKTPVDEELVTQDAYSAMQVDLEVFNIISIDVDTPSFYAEEIYQDTPTQSYIVSCSAENEIANFESDYELVYHLDKTTGWKCLSVNRIDYNEYPKHDPDPSYVEEIIRSELGDYYRLISHGQSGKSKQEFTYQADDSTSYKYVNMHYNVTAECDFDPFFGWRVAVGSRELYDVDINATGTWSYDDGKGEHKYVFNILSVDDNQVTYTADITLTDWVMIIGTETITGSTNGETRQKSWNRTSAAEYSLKTDEHVLKYYENTYYLEFYAFTGSQYDESGFYFNGQKLTRNS